MESRLVAGSLGPRLAGRLTPELILRSPQYMNCVGTYQIDLRGNKIGAIENLGATENQFDCIDLSDNAVVILDGFPKLPRLKALYLNNNRIMRIARKLEEQIPNLEMLILTNNKISQLSVIDSLAELTKLTHLSLLDNPVTKLENYRLYVMHTLPKLKVLDFSKVKQKERAEAERIFGPIAGSKGESDRKRTRAAQAAENGPSTSNGPTPAQAPKPTLHTPEQLTAIRAAIANAQTLEEVQKLEAALKSGQQKLPSEIGDAGEVGGKRQRKGAEDNDTEMAEAGDGNEGAENVDGDAVKARAAAMEVDS